MSEIVLPTLTWDFALVPLAEQSAWRNALASHIVDQLDMPVWKKQEQIEPLNLTISILVEDGFTDPRDIVKEILKNVNGNTDASRK